VILTEYCTLLQYFVS